MPCDDPGAEQEQRGLDRHEIAHLDAMLCEVCRSVSLTALPDTVQAWWKNHEAKDRRRAAEQRRQRAITRAELKRDIAQAKRELAALED